MLLEISRNLIICHGLIMLRRNENSVDTYRNHGSILRNGHVHPEQYQDFVAQC
ncbi:hypothetical protein NC652_025996 [Populus alba x Populus x berolinensis]|nr:hypothetical protein NC652_025996 [Populus alba x Populus x berolinensis]